MTEKSWEIKYMKMSENDKSMSHEALLKSENKKERSKKTYDLVKWTDSKPITYEKKKREIRLSLRRRVQIHSVKT